MSITVKTAVVHGVAWLYDIAQPPGALVAHHGIHTRANEDERLVWFVPQGPTGLPVVVVSAWRPEGGVFRTPFIRAEVTRLADWLTSLNLGVADVRFPPNYSNGTEWTGAIDLTREANPSLVASLRAYESGCPKHRGSVLGCPTVCTWKSEGLARLRVPGILASSGVRV